MGRRSPLSGWSDVWVLAHTADFYNFPACRSSCPFFASENRIHSLALRATNSQDLRTPRKFYYAAKSAGCLTLAFCVTSTKQRRTEPNVGGDRPRQPAVDGGSRTLGRAPRWGANVAWGSLPRVRCATLGYDVQPRCGCREGHCQILELGTWNLEPGTSTWVDGQSQRQATNGKNPCEPRKIVPYLPPEVIGAPCPPAEARRLSAGRRLHGL